MTRAISGILEVGVGGKPAELGTLSPEHDSLCWKVTRTVVNYGLYPVGKERETWVITPDVLSLTGYVCWPSCLPSALSDRKSGWQTG